MRVAIITLSLLNNYGGIIQNYALQQVLKKMQISSVTVDNLKIPTAPFVSYLCSWIKSFLLLFTSKRRSFIPYSHRGTRNSLIQAFITKYVSVTKKCYSYKSIPFVDYDAIIVGSDQVWRPKYNYRVEDRFLKFAKDISIKRVAYAASFGVDNWEYTSKQTKVCSVLAKKFNAISVREKTGVDLCKKYLDVDAVCVLDPTLLLTKEDYLAVCNDVPICREKYLAVYVLDENAIVTTTYEKEAVARGLVVKVFHADAKSTLTVPEWLAMFRDASFVVTDSFHGTVFSIIFGKEFKCIYNEGRGAARFESLLNLYNSGKLEEMREFSINWLKHALETK